MKKEIMKKILTEKKGYIGPDIYVASKRYIYQIAKELNIKVHFWGELLYIDKR